MTGLKWDTGVIPAQTIDPAQRSGGDQGCSGQLCVFSESRNEHIDYVAKEITVKDGTAAVSTEV